MEKIVVVGVGFIGGYLQAGYRALVGDELRGRVFGVKGRAAGLAEKRAALPFDVSAGDTAAVLARENPTVIILSPPPSAVPGIVREVLKPDFDRRRAAGLPLPEIYTFAPTPGVSFFREALGADVHAAKVLPNIIDRVGGVDLSPIGMNYVSTDPADRWPEARLRALETVLAPYGESVVLTDRDSLVLLAGKITSHVCYEVCFTLTDALERRGTPVPLAALGSALRAAHREFCRPPLPDLHPCTLDGLPAGLPTFMRALARAWFDGLSDFSASAGLTIPPEQARRVDHRSFELNIFPLQVESREWLVQNTQNAATKGGVLERGIEYYGEHIEARLARAVCAQLDGQPEEGFFDWLRGQSEALSRAAFERSLALAER